MTPKIVVTLHGIRTHGGWQKDITPYLARYGIVPYHLDYGWFGVLSFLLPWSRQRQLQWLRHELRDLLDRTRTNRISIIAHSFGTYLILEALQAENGGFLYDRVVLTGSIVRRDFPWPEVTGRRWLMAVRNERARSDWVVKLAEMAARWWPGACPAGSTGATAQFAAQTRHLIEHAIDGGHSEVLNRRNYEKWARFIAYPVLCEEHLGAICSQLEYLRAFAAKALGLAAQQVRTNLFVPSAGKLRMVPKAWDNMTYAPEHDIELEPGHGCTGHAYRHQTPFFVTRDGASWSGGVLPKSEEAKVNPRMCWVISLPLGDWSEQQGKIQVMNPVGVVNIDGLDNIPSLLQTPMTQSLDDFLKVLWLQTEKVREHLSIATQGELPHAD